MEVSRERKYEGYFSVDALKVKTTKGNLVTREVMNRKDGTCAIVYDTINKQFVFVEQYRPGTGKQLLEIPAGTLDIPGEDPCDGIIREIDEEIGYKVDQIEYITECYMSPGGSTEKLFIYHAEVSLQLHEGGGTENEDINIIRIHRDNLAKYKFDDAKTIIAVRFAIDKYNLK